MQWNCQLKNREVARAELLRPRVVRFRRFTRDRCRFAMCTSMNVMQSRHRLHARSRDELSVMWLNATLLHMIYAARVITDSAGEIGRRRDASLGAVRSAPTKFPREQHARADLSRAHAAGARATVLMRHALMSATDKGYAAGQPALTNSVGSAVSLGICRITILGCRALLERRIGDYPPISSAMQRGCVRAYRIAALMAALRECGLSRVRRPRDQLRRLDRRLLAIVEARFSFPCLMAPIVNVRARHCGKVPRRAFMRRRTPPANIERSLVARHFHLSSPSHNQPLCRADCVLFVAGEFDLIARLADIEKIQQKCLDRNASRTARPFRLPHDSAKQSRRLKERG